MKEPIPQQCSKPVWRGFHSYSCHRKGIVERDGKWYCKQHDPVEVEKRDEARKAKWDAEWKQKQASWDRAKVQAEAYPQMLAILHEVRDALQPSALRNRVLNVIELAERGLLNDGLH